MRASKEDTATSRIRAEVAAAVGVAARYVQPIDPSEVPRSAIGKVQRASLRERVRAHALAARHGEPPVAPLRATAAPLDSRVREIVARVLQIRADTIDAGQPLEDVVALDSLALVEIVSELEQELVLRIHGDALPDRVTLDDLIDDVRARGQPPLLGRRDAASSACARRAPKRVRYLPPEAEWDIAVGDAEARRLAIAWHVEGAERQVDEREHAGEVAVQAVLLRGVVPAVEERTREHVAQRTESMARSRAPGRRRT